MRQKPACCTLVLALLLPALGAQGQQDPCSSTGALDTYLNTRLQVHTATTQAQAQEEVADAGDTTRAVQCRRADSDGLGTGPIDLLCRAFVALDLGEISEEQGALVFNFNPEFMQIPAIGQLSPRLVVHQPALWGGLSTQLDTLPESIRQDRKDSLTEGLADLDDVEFQVRWNYQGQPDGGPIEEAARVLFEDALDNLGTELRGIPLELGTRLAVLAQQALRTVPRLAGKTPADVTVQDVCGAPDLRASFLELAEWTEQEPARFLTAFHESLTAERFFDLADLYEGQPKLIAEGTRRIREEPAGPDQWSLTFRGEIGSVSFWGWKRWAKRNAKGLDAASFREYLDQQRGSMLPLFVVKAEYKDISPLHVPLPADNFSYDVKGSEVGSASVQMGTYLFGSRTSRIDLETKYDFSSDDKVANNRFVGTLTWTQALSGELAKLAGGTELAVTFIYADKPEFRGEVDEELSLRAGLKWSISGN